MYDNGVEQLNARLLLEQEVMQKHDGAEASALVQYKQHVSFEAAQFRMRTQGGSELCEIVTYEMAYTATHTSAGDTFMSLECKQLEIFNHLKDCSPHFRLAMKPLEPKTQSELKQKGCIPLLAFAAHTCPPVSGIQVYATMHVSFQPIAVALSGTLVSGLQNFFWPPAAENAPPIVTATVESQPNSPTPSGGVEPETTLSPGGEQVAAMVERENVVKALGHVTFSKMAVQLSYQKYGGHKTSKLDFNEVTAQLTGNVLIFKCAVGHC